MAGKQLGKLRQWGREVISSKEKTVLTEEFKQVEQDIELRRIGIERLHATSSEYHGYLQKKKEYPIVEEGVKMLPIDALGAVMMAHGDEFGQDSAFGQCLVKLGRAHCKIATLQETFALTFKDTYLASLNENLDDIEEYNALRKKLDSRRLTYDAAVTKLNKAKKEKDVKEAEDEVDLAKRRYEDTSTEIRSRMRSIQENEIRQLRDLTKLLNDEVDFISQYLDILRGTREEWLDESSIQRLDDLQEIGAAHEFNHGRSTPSISSTSRTNVPSRPASAASRRKSTETEIDRRGSISRRSSPAPPPPRPSSRASVGSSGTAHEPSHKRRDSTGSEVGATPSKRLSVAGWASSALPSFSSSKAKKEPKKEKIKDKDKSATRAFANLENHSDDSEDDSPIGLESESRTRSFSSFGSSTLSKMLGSSSRTTSQTNNFSSSNSSFNSYSGSKASTNSASKKIMRALYDFDGTADQLTFKAGDEITVIYEGRDGWHMGELEGKRGLFPSTYAEESSSGSRPPLPQRPSTIAQRAQMEVQSEDDASILSEDLYSPAANVISAGMYNDFGNLQLQKSPMTAEGERFHSPSDIEDEERRNLFEPPDTPALFGSPVQPTANGFEIGNRAGNPISPPRPPPPPIPQRKQSTKRPPPPPPPARRSTGTVSSTTTTAPAAPAISFPPPPAAPKRPGSRSRSSTLVTAQASVTESPFNDD